MSIVLFENLDRKDMRPSSHNENQYDYLNISARTEIGNIRSVLEQWFLAYPDGDKEDMKERLMTSFNHAFFELFTHEYFTRLGYMLSIHPTLPDATTHPDYLACKGDSSFYLECKYLELMGTQQSGHERRLNTLYDAISKIDSTNFLLDIGDIIFKGNGQPSGKRIIKYYNEIVGKIRPEEVENAILVDGLDALPNYIYEDDLITVKLRLMPKVKSGRGKGTNAIGIYPGEVKWGDDADTIKDALQRKASRYGNLDLPLVVCLNKPCISLDQIEIQNALFGSLAWSWSNDPNNKDERLVRGNDGIFGSRSQPKRTRLSAALITNVNTANLTKTASVELIHHPYAKNKLELVLDKTITDVLGLPVTYPYS